MIQATHVRASRIQTTHVRASRIPDTHEKKLDKAQVFEREARLSEPSLGVRSRGHVHKKARVA
jgi:hypothetical protein